MSDSGYSNSDKSEQVADSFAQNNTTKWYQRGTDFTPNRTNTLSRFQNSLSRQEINHCDKMASNIGQKDRGSHKCNVANQNTERLNPDGHIKPPPIPAKPNRPQTLSQPNTFQSAYNHTQHIQRTKDQSNSPQRPVTSQTDIYSQRSFPVHARSTPSPTGNSVHRGPPPPYEYHLYKQHQSGNKTILHKVQRSFESTSSSDTSQRNGSDFGSSGSLPIGYGGWSPSASVVRANPHTDEDRKKAQVAAYTQWVNIQLKRRPGSRPIEDLQQDMRDGVALAHLIEIIAGVTLEDVHENPRNESDMEANVEQAIHFMTSRRIRMHHTTASDIVCGSIKPIMRLILALAAHFKPNSVRQSSSPAAAAAAGSSPRTQQTVAGIAQGAAAALADIKRDALRTSQRPRRPRHLQQQRQQEQQASSSDAGTTAQSDSAQPPRPTTVGAVYTQQASSNAPEAGGGGADDSASDMSASLEVSAEMYAALQEEHAALHVQMADTRTTLIALQDLLLNGRVPDGSAGDGDSIPSEESQPAEGTSIAEEIVLWKARLQQAEEVTSQLRLDLSKAKQECLQLQGVKSGLAERLKEQEESLLVMKAELLRSGFCQQTLDTTNNELLAKLQERDHTILDLRRELAKKDRDMDELKASQEVEREQKESIARNLRTQITELHSRLRRVGETEATLSARVASQDRKMARLEGKILHHPPPMQQRSTRHSATQSCVSSDDYQLVRDSLQSLRTRFPGNHPQNQTIDQLESSISSLMDRLQSQEIHDDSRNVERPPDNSVQSSPGSGDSSSSTKLLYFTDRTVTPFMCTVHKRLGDITLADIKALIDRPGGYRYHFKAMDPEFGTVKEEISHDEDVIPGWEGKIVAWIEEDHG